MKSLLLALPLLVMPTATPEPQPFQGYIPPRPWLAVCNEDNGVCTVHEKYLAALIAKAKQCRVMQGERDL